MDAKVSALKRLQEIVDVLRGPQGCPWDKEQTLNDMSRYLLEEASEAADAIDDAGGGATREVCEELGDLLMNILLAARIAEDQGAFSVEDVAREIADKLVRRHPHVFGTTAVAGVEDVLRNWQAIKEDEKRRQGLAARPASRLDGVPRSLPPLERAFEVGRKAAKAGFDWPDAASVLEKIAEEMDEVRRQLAVDHAGKQGDLLEEELGDLLFAAVSLCRKLDVRPDAALRRTLRKFCARFRFIEECLPEIEKATLAEMEALWQEAKTQPLAGKDGGLE